MDERLMELETKFSFQEDTLRELGEVIIGQLQPDEHARRMAALQSHGMRHCA